MIWCQCIRRSFLRSPVVDHCIILVSIPIYFFVCVVWEDRYIGQDRISQCALRLPAVPDYQAGGAQSCVNKETAAEVQEQQHEALLQQVRLRSCCG